MLLLFGIQWEYVLKLKMHMSFDQAIPLLGVYPIEPLDKNIHGYLLQRFPPVAESCTSVERGMEECVLHC